MRTLFHDVLIIKPFPVVNFELSTLRASRRVTERLQKPPPPAILLPAHEQQQRGGGGSVGC